MGRKKNCDGGRCVCVCVCVCVIGGDCGKHPSVGVPQQAWCVMGKGGCCECVCERELCVCVCVLCVSVCLCRSMRWICGGDE
jgi:hypothetical protein